MNCPVCGQEECGLHDSVLWLTHLLNPLLIALALVGGVLAMAIAR